MSRLLRVIAPVTLAVPPLLVGIGAAAPAIAAKPPPTAHQFDGTPTVGALFLNGLYPALHTCTASVVRTPQHDVIVTAAHCMQPDNGKGYTFVPGYDEGAAPYGAWTTTGAYASHKWIKRDGDTRRDFAFLTVAPRMIDGKRRNIQDVVGGNRLGLAPPKHKTVRVIGYPLGAAGRPLRCVSHVYRHKGYPGSHCHGFGDGTSGGPWLAGHGKIRTVVGLISGLHQGGCTPAVIYSTPLGHPARGVLKRAEHRKHPDTFPQRPGDGCPSANSGTPSPVG